MPWEWYGEASLEWMQTLAIYFSAWSLARAPRKPMSEEQLAAAPNVMSHDEAEAHLRSIGAIA